MRSLLYLLTILTIPIILMIREIPILQEILNSHMTPKGVRYTDGSPFHRSSKSGVRGVGANPRRFR